VFLVLQCSTEALIGEAKNIASYNCLLSC